MKKQYVRGYGDNSSQKEKTALAVLAGVCIAAGLITLFTVSLIKGNKPKEQAVTKSEDRQVVEEVFENTNKTYEPEINSDNEDITKENISGLENKTIKLKAYAHQSDNISLSGIESAALAWYVDAF